MKPMQPADATKKNAADGMISNVNPAALLGAMPAGACLFDVHDLRVVAHNQAYQSYQDEPHRTTGLVGLRLQDFVAGDDEARLVKLHRLAALGETVNVHRVPLRRRERGETLWNMQLSPVHDERGDVRWVLTTMWDITEQALPQRSDPELAATLRGVNEQLAVATLEAQEMAQREQTAREELQVQNDQLRAINGFLIETQEQLRKLSHAVQQSPSTVVITNLQGNIEYVNPKFTQTTGYSPEEVIGQNPRFLKSGEMPHAEYERLWKTINAGGEWRGEFHNRRKNGELYWEFASISPIRNAEGAITHFVAVKEDITERKRVEQQREQLLAQVQQQQQRMEEMIHLIAHDVRQPLTITRGHVQFLRRSLARGDHQQVERSIEAIELSTKRLESMIRDLVDSAQLEAGQLRLERHPVALEEFVRKALARLSLALGERQIHVEVRNPVAANADPDRLERVLGNLVSNAVKYGGPDAAVVVSIGQQDEEAVISVSDRGPGIDPADLPHLFDRGYRAIGTQGAEGLGLGLYIARLLVESHGGRIWVESQRGLGSTFSFTLPRA